MEETIKKLSIELNLPPEVIERVYKAFWQYIRTNIESYPLKKDLSEEEFNKLRLNFNIPNLGKLACTYNRYVGMKKKEKILKENGSHR